jgi:hypothetical protein
MRFVWIPFGATLVLACPLAALAQGHDHGQHGQHGPPEVATPGPTPEGAMRMHGPLGLSPNREGSGTAWLPDETEMRMFHGRAGPFDVMGHFNIFGGIDYQSSDQGDSQPVSSNWFMGMAETVLAGGHLKGRAMLSLEPLTVGKAGYPLLLQTGETYQGQPLVDRQHPHDLFMETALMYTRPLGADVAVQVYGGPVGEPALGPVAFPHRQSAAADPLAPLGHHWLDSSHITFGVVTAGIMTRWAKLEGSWFNGREPDEDRYDFDLGSFDSYSGRLTVNPSRRWSLQGSYGYLDSPEEVHPGEAVHRYTTSAVHTARWGDGRSWATTAALGVNQHEGSDFSPAALLESSVDLGRYGTTFGRVEYLRKGAEEFGLPGEAEFDIGSVVVGHLHAFSNFLDVEPAVGARVSLNLIDAGLESRYGTRIPFGAMAFVRLAPAMRM